MNSLLIAGFSLYLKKIWLIIETSEAFPFKTWNCGTEMNIKFYIFIHAEFLEIFQLNHSGLILFSNLSDSARHYKYR